MLDQHLHHRFGPRVALLTQEIVVIRDLAASLAAGVEARHAARPLAVQRKKAEAFRRLRARRLVARPEPLLEHRFRLGKQLFSHTKRSRTSMPSETFSCTPSLRGETPSATPRSWVK